ncbi:hypothetical protein TNCV_920941 [Trichonephila clavipes]|nr:hypothetical protein TNCV_920941 [Trichonephila clavipes]
MLELLCTQSCLHSMPSFGTFPTNFDGEHEGGHRCLTMYSAFAAWEYSKQPSNRKSSHAIGGRGREAGGPWPPPGVLPQNRTGAKSHCHRNGVESYV